MASFGSAFTGQGDQTDEPLKNIVTGAGAALNRSVFDDPASRSALLQIGLNLMQPQAQGQSVAGHIGEAVGAGGEAVGRQEEGDIKQQLADTKLQRAQDLMDIARLKMNQSPDGLTAYQRLMEANRLRTQERLDKGDARAQARAERDANAREDDIIDNAAAARYKESHGYAADPNDPDAKKTQDEIRDEIAARRKARNPIPPSVPTDTAVTPPQAAGGDLPPPRADRIPGQTKWRGHVWAKDPATGQFGWAGQ